MPLGLKKVVPSLKFEAWLVRDWFETGLRLAWPENKKHKYIYRWKGCFDGTLELLYERYRKHHNHQNLHKSEEIKLILDMRKLNSHNEPAIFWIKLKHREYSCTITCLCHFFVSRDFLTRLTVTRK